MRLYRGKEAGNGHVNVAVTYGCMGNVGQSLGNFQKALEYYEKSLEIYLKSYGGTHASVTTTKKNIGIVHGEMGDQITAKAY